MLRIADCWRKQGLTGGYLGSAMVIVQSLSEPGSEGAGLWGGRRWGDMDHGSGRACGRGLSGSGATAGVGGSVECGVRGVSCGESGGSWLVEDDVEDGTVGGEVSGEA